MKKKIFLTAALALLTFGCIGGGAAALTKTVEDTAITVNAAETEQYTVTVSQADMGDTVITFGADTVLAEDGETVLVYAVNDLPNLVASMLPENTELATYAWAETIPETFELKDYTFTVVETLVEAPSTSEKPTASETEKDDKKGGCGSVVGLVGATAMLALAGVALLGKKKED